MDAFHLLFCELVARIINLLIIADRLGGVVPLDPGLPGLTQTDRVHASLPAAGLLESMLPI